MKRSIKSTLAAATLALTASSTLTADACDRGGRISIGRSYGYSSPRPTYPQYARPTYSQPAYGQPTYSQPQPVYGQTQPRYSQPAVAPRPVSSIGRPLSQPVPQRQVPQQVTPQRVAPQPVASQGVARRPIASQGVNQARVNPAPASQTAAPARPPAARQQAAPQSAPQATPQSNAANSALQLLASMNTPAMTQPTSPAPTTAAQDTNQIPQFSTPTDPAAGIHVGTWKVALPGNQSVQLTLNDDRSFSWTATKQGRSSSFDGQYRLESGRLTLVRSSDLQQMAGSWTGQEAKFTFKLDGATTSGLAFTLG
ncbi:MAG: hypothetical protein ACR2NZ_19435 [Rubripirellula sp.]